VIQSEKQPRLNVVLFLVKHDTVLEGFHNVDLANHCGRICCWVARSRSG
jgi:hypothetical protein